MTTSRAAALWPAALIGLLGLTVAANLWVMRIASADPTMVVERDYYRKALAWDARQAEFAANAALGWGLQPHTADGLVLELQDRDGAPVRGAALVAQASAHRAADREVPVPFVETAPGRYAATAVPGSGRWRLHVAATRGEARFVATIDVDLP